MAIGRAGHSACAQTERAHSSSMGVSDEASAIIADEVFHLMLAPREVFPFSDRFPWN